MKSRNRRNSSRPWSPASRNNIKDRKKVKCLETPTTVEAFVVDLFVLKEVGRAGGQSERQGTSYSFSRLLKALRLYIRVCVCVLTRWPFGRVRLVLSSHVAQIMCVGRHHCAHHGTSNQFHVQCQPIFSFTNPNDPQRPYSLSPSALDRHKARKWLCVCNSVVYTHWTFVCEIEREREIKNDRENIKYFLDPRPWL